MLLEEINRARSGLVDHGHRQIQQERIAIVMYQQTDGDSQKYIIVSNHLFF